MKNIKTFEAIASVGPVLKDGLTFANLSRGKKLTDGKTTVHIKSVGADSLDAVDSNNKHVEIKNLKGWRLTESSNYYKGELDNLDTKTEHTLKVKITGEGGSTKWMDLNKESAQALCDWLTQNYK